VLQQARRTDREHGRWGQESPGNGLRPHLLGASPKLGRRDLGRLPPDERTPLHYLMEFPGSPLATVLREVCAEMARGGARQVLAVSGVARGDGASATALCLARTAAAWGRDTVLVDCDLRNRTLTQFLGCDPSEGFWEATQGRAALERVLITAPDYGFLAAPLARPDNPVRDLFSGGAVRDTFATLRSRFQCVVLDLPPALGSVDAAMLARLADASLLAVRAGKRGSSRVARAGAVLARANSGPVYLLHTLARSAKVGAPAS